MIQRVRFFDGQFLKDVDFQEEQAYHLHMRRRMNYFLFGQSGVLQLGSEDLRFFQLNTVDKTFRVRAGMAISRDDTRQEGTEVILSTDSPPIDLDTSGITAGGTAYVTLRFAEEQVKDPPSEGDVDENTRYREVAVLEVHASPPSSPAPNGSEYLLLGSILYNTMVASYTVRQEARLRAALLPAPPPTITGVSGTTTGTAGGAAVSLGINGSNLTGATAVTFSDPGVTGTVSTSSATVVVVTVTVAAGTAAGPKSFTVTTPAGVASSPGGVSFTVAGAVPAPTLTGINVHSGAQGATVNATLSGTNLSGVTGVTFSGTGITTAIGSGGTATSLPITLTIASTATTGARTFTVTTPGGTASSSGVAGADFTVTTAVTLHSLQPNLQITGAVIEIHGTNIRDPALAAGAAATGTTVVLKKAATTKAVTTGTVRPDAFGRQVVQITIPNRTGTTWANKESVTLELTFGGGTASLPFNYDD